MAKAKKETAASGVTPYKTGEAGLNTRKNLDASAQARREKAVSRFFMDYDEKGKDGEPLKLVFVDDIGYWAWVHTIKIGEKKFENVICSKDHSPCPLCERGEKAPQWIAHFTVIDTRSFPDKKNPGKFIKNRKVLLPMKQGTNKCQTHFFDDKKTKGKGSFVGWSFEVQRLGEMAPNSGSLFIPRKKVDMIKLFGKDALTPLDYDKILAMPTTDELIAIGFKSDPIPGSRAVIDQADLSGDL